jgi:hypothetical protein
LTEAINSIWWRTCKLQLKMQVVNSVKHAKKKGRNLAKCIGLDLCASTHMTTLALGVHKHHKPFHFSKLLHCYIIFNPLLHNKTQKKFHKEKNKKSKLVYRWRSPRKDLQQFGDNRKDKNSTKTLKKSIKACHLSQLLKLW